MSEPTPPQDAFEAYAKAVGSVVYEWNYLHEELGRLFVIVRSEDRGLLLAKWWSCETDKRQRKMLKDAVTNAPKVRWKKLPKAFNDLNWLLDRAEELAEDRNNAVHAPCSPYLNADGSTEVKAAYLSAHQRHPRAEKLMGKDLLVEFAWCAWYAATFKRFHPKIRMAIGALERYEWPERPKIPTRADFSGASHRRSKDERTRSDPLS